MAQFLTTAGVNYHIEKIILEADEFLQIISPYLKGMSPLIQRRIWSKCQEGQVYVSIVYRHEKRQPSNIKEWLSSMPNVFAVFCENLHAKCYMNEKEALVTSLNLTEHAQVNNYEMGVLVSYDTDWELYKQVYDEANVIYRASKIVYEPNWNKEARLRIERRRDLAEDTSPGILPESGFCLRCGTEIPCDAERPYCNSHFRTWARFGNEDYKEEYCHTCGADHATSMSKPLCLSRIKKYGSVLRATG